MHIEQKLKLLINDLKLKKEKAIAVSIKCRAGKDLNGAKQKEERSKAFSFCIQKLTEILNEVSVAASETPEQAYWRGWKERGNSGG